MSSERDCNTCANHVQGSVPELCKACLGPAFGLPGKWQPLRFYQPKETPVEYPKIEIVDTETGAVETIEVTDLSPHAVVTDHPAPAVTPAAAGAMRGFASGATRTNDAGRIDPEAFLSPAVLLRYCEYMNRNRTQADGSIRAGDNWQKGIPVEAYRKSIQRHNLELWSLTRDPAYVHPEGKNIEDVLCALMFNHMGMLHELLKAKAAA